MERDIILVLVSSVVIASMFGLCVEVYIRANDWRWIQRIKCLFGFHGKGRWQIEIYDIRFASHAIEYGQHYRCEHCEKIIECPIDNE